jgi:hypothetical protein
MIRGNIPYDDGHLILSEQERQQVSEEFPEVMKYIRRYGGAYEMLNNDWRYCLYLDDAPPDFIRNNTFVRHRVGLVRNFRIGSTTASVRDRASTPHKFGDSRQPNSDYLLVPRVSSSSRLYIPLGYIDREHNSGKTQLMPFQMLLLSFSEFCPH